MMSGLYRILLKDCREFGLQSLYEISLKNVYPILTGGLLGVHRILTKGRLGGLIHRLLTKGSPGVYRILTKRLLISRIHCRGSWYLRGARGGAAGGTRGEGGAVFFFFFFFFFFFPGGRLRQGRRRGGQ